MARKSLTQINAGGRGISGPIPPGNATWCQCHWNHAPFSKGLGPRRSTTPARRGPFAGKTKCSQLELGFPSLHFGLRPPVTSSVRQCWVSALRRHCWSRLLSDPRAGDGGFQSAVVNKLMGVNKVYSSNLGGSFFTSFLNASCLTAF